MKIIIAAIAALAVATSGVEAGKGKINCAVWNDKYDCPKNWCPIAKPKNMDCILKGAKPYQCYQVCCKKVAPPPPPPPAPTTCGSAGVRCWAGYSLIPNQGCGMRGYPPCNRDNCCVENPPPPPPPSTCGDWFDMNNMCDGGSSPVPNPYTKCNLAKRGDCRRKCCARDPPPPPPTNTVTCYQWMNHLDNTCDWQNGFAPVPDAKIIKCDLTIDGDCNSMCCWREI